MTVPVPFPGHTFDGLIKNFSLTDTKFSLPDPFADPDSDSANPQISANIVVIAAVPSEMNFELNVTQVRANADVYYKEKKLGVLDLDKWQPAQSERLESKKGEHSLKIQARIENAPLNITDDDVFTDVIQALLFGGKTVMLKVDALVAVEVSRKNHLFPRQCTLLVMPQLTKPGFHCPWRTYYQRPSRNGKCSCQTLAAASIISSTAPKLTRLQRSLQAKVSLL